VSDFIEERATFPNGAHDDQVDAMTQALLRSHMAVQQETGLVSPGLSEGLPDQPDLKAETAVCRGDLQLRCDAGGVTCRKCKVPMKELKGHIYHKQRKWACPLCAKIRMQKQK
jgi:hypothetical protein